MAAAALSALDAFRYGGCDGSQRREVDEAQPGTAGRGNGSFVVVVCTFSCVERGWG